MLPLGPSGSNRPSCTVARLRVPLAPTAWVSARPVKVTVTAARAPGASGPTPPRVVLSTSVQVSRPSLT
jgi:hypothetical protein